MNQRELYTQRNKTARLFSWKNRIHRNCIRLNAANSLDHEILKAKVCYSLLKQGHAFLTEAELENGKARADVVDLDIGRVIEVIISESEASLDHKRALYEKAGLRFSGLTVDVI